MLSKAWGHHGSSEVLGGEWRHLDPCPSSEWTWQVIRLSGLWFSQFQKNFVGFSDLRHWNLLPVTDCPQLKDNFWFPYSTPTSHLLFPEKKKIPWLLIFGVIWGGVRSWETYFLGRQYFSQRYFCLKLFLLPEQPEKMKGSHKNVNVL